MAAPFATLKTRETAIWLLLMLLTVLNLSLSSPSPEPTTQPGYATVLLLILAFFKVHLVMTYFMEVRHATTELKVSCQLWLIACFVLVTTSNMGLLN